MEDRNRTGNGNTSNMHGNSDPKSRMAEYITNCYGYNNSNDIRSIINETKIGAQRRQHLHKMLNTVFSTP